MLAWKPIVPYGPMLKHVFFDMNVGSETFHVLAELFAQHTRVSVLPK